MSRILERINEAANEVLAIYLRAGRQGGRMPESEHRRLHQLQAELVRLWEMRRIELAGRPSVWDQLRFGA